LKENIFIFFHLTIAAATAVFSYTVGPPPSPLESRRWGGVAQYERVTRG